VKYTVYFLSIMRAGIKCVWWLTFAGLCLVLPARATAADEIKTFQSEKHAFRVVTLVEGLQHPWSMAWLPDGRMLVTERAGRLRMVSRDFKLDSKPIEGLPQIAAVGQGGLFDVVLHPGYADNGWIYIAYSGPGRRGEPR
jgi:glucose/arabinose dehydrogenase